MNGLASPTQESRRVGQPTSPRSTGWSGTPDAAGRAVPTAGVVHPRVGRSSTTDDAPASCESVAGPQTRSSPASAGTHLPDCTVLQELPRGRICQSVFGAAGSHPATTPTIASPQVRAGFTLSAT